MGSRRRQTKYAKAHHQYLLALEEQERRKKESKQVKKAQQKEEVSLANALSSFNVGEPVNAPKVGAPVVASPSKDDSDDNVMDIEKGRSLRGITKRNKSLKKRRERRAKIARRAKERVKKQGIAMSIE